MNKLILLLLSVVVAISCTKQNELSDSVYISDSEYPELPAYTELGYNTFGANYDRTVFVYSQYEIPLKVTVENNKLAFIFQGVDGINSGSNLTLRFILPDSNVIRYQDLLVYNDTIIDLSGDDIVVEMITDGNIQVLDIIEGELNFKRSQKVFVDDVEKEIILSGYFNLKFLVNNIPSNMSNGRFDFGINNENFYNLE